MTTTIATQSIKVHWLFQGKWDEGIDWRNCRQLRTSVIVSTNMQLVTMGTPHCRKKLQWIHHHITSSVGF